MQKPKAMYRKLLETMPGFLWTRVYIGKTLLAQGKPEAALAMVQQELTKVVWTDAAADRVAGSRPEGRSGRGTESPNRCDGPTAMRSASP